MKYRKIWSFLLIFTLLFTLGAGFAPTVENKTVSGAEKGGFQDLNQQEIVKAMSPGWNLGNQMEANLGGTPSEDAWTHVMVTERMIRTVKKSGFNSIRIPVSYLSLIGEGPDYQIDEAWLNRVQEIVDWAIQYQLYVVINIHGDGYSTVKGGWLLPEAEDQDTIKAKYKAVWQQIADRFKDYDQHLIMESMNEIGAELNEEEQIRSIYENINAYNQIFVDTVRQSGGNNAKRWLLIPGWNTDIQYTVGDYGFTLPTDNYLSSDVPKGEKRIMISVHYYSPWAFCGENNYTITQWGDEADKKKTVGYQQESYMEEQFTAMKEKFVKQGYPVVIGEWGCVDKTRDATQGDSENNTFRAYYAWKLCSLAVKNSFVPMYWDNGWNGEFGFAIFDRSTYEVTQPEILEAIISCYRQTAGTATGITLNKKILELDLADSGQNILAELTPSDSTDSIQWSSSDESVARVSYKGKVFPAGIGTCIITATVPGGASDYCIVRVTPPKSFKAGLYAGNSSDWNTLECDEYLTLSENGEGTYTISMSGSKEQMSMLNTLFIKDVTVERNVAKESILQSGDFVIDWMKFNDYTCTLSQKEFSFSKSEGSTALDLCILNYWWEPSNYIEGLTKNDATQSYSFPSSAYLDDKNTITMQISIKNAVLEDTSSYQETKVTSLALSKKNVALNLGENISVTATVSPRDATEKVVWFSENPNVATVDKAGSVTGVAAGETTIHALTISGMDEICKVTVKGAPVKGPGHNQGGQTGSSGNGNKVKSLAKGAVFTVGNLKYKVTNATKGKTKVAVQAPKNKKVKSLTVPATVKMNRVTYKVTTIGNNAFKNCKRLKKIVIGKNVLSIGKNAFKNAKVLKKITVKSNLLKSVGKNACKGIHKKAVIKVPKKKLKKYKNLFQKSGKKKTVKIIK